MNLRIPSALDGDLNPIFGVLRSATGIDFTNYKHNTIVRRIERRMAVHGIGTLKEYSQKAPPRPRERSEDFSLRTF